jgi:hypothetical protein
MNITFRVNGYTQQLSISLDGKLLVPTITLELLQDLRSVFGVDMELELAKLLEMEIKSDILVRSGAIDARNTSHQIVKQLNKFLKEPQI